MARGSTGAVEEAGPEDLNVGRWRASLTPLIPPVEPYPVTIYGTRHHISAICYQIAEELSEEKELVHKKSLWAHQFFQFETRLCVPMSFLCVLKKYRWVQGLHSCRYLLL